MPHIHSQDKPFRPDIDKADTGKQPQNVGSDATFALDDNDPASVENRGGLEATIDGDADHTDPTTQSEYSSDSPLRSNDTNSANYLGNDGSEIDASAVHAEDVSSSNEANNTSGIMDELEAEMDDRIEYEESELDNYPQPSEGSED
jgi:hypothetical protein